MSLGLGMSMGLSNRRRGGDPSEALLQTADYYWNASDWSGTGAWSPRVGSADASTTSATKVPTGGTYNTDKTADRDLVWIPGAGLAKVALPTEALPSVADGASHTVVVVGKVFAVSLYASIYVARDSGSPNAGSSMAFWDGNADIVASLDKGAASVLTPRTAAVTLGSWEAFSTVLDPTNLKAWTTTRGDDGFQSIARGTFGSVPSAPLHQIGLSHAGVYPLAIAISKIAIWQTEALTVDDLKRLAGP